MKRRLPEHIYTEQVPTESLPVMGCRKLIKRLSPQEVADATFTLPRKAEYYEVERGNGSIGIHKVTNEIEGVSILPVDIVNGKLFAGLCNPPRFPLAVDRDGNELLSNDPSEPIKSSDFEDAIREGRTGGQRWEVAGGGVMNFGPPQNGEYYTQEERDLILRKSASQEGYEEAGIISSPESLILLGRRDVATAAEKRIAYSYLADQYSYDNSQHLEASEEGMRFRMFDADTLLKMIDLQRITEAKTIADICAVALMKKYRGYF